MKKYDKRIADLLLVRKRGVMGGVLIEGANWCWETTAAEQISPSVPYMSDPGKKGQYLDMAEVSPRSRLPGKTPCWTGGSLSPKLWAAIRFKTDHRGGWRQFVLTGFAVSSKTGDIHHSGIGILLGMNKEKQDYMIKKTMERRVS